MGTMCQRYTNKKSLHNREGEERKGGSLDTGKKIMV